MVTTMSNRIMNTAKVAETLTVTSKVTETLSENLTVTVNDG